MLSPCGMILQAFSSDLFAEDWTAAALSAVIAAVAIGLMFGTSRLLSSRRHSEVKLTPYECGIPPTPYGWSNINVRFYIFAILFLIFDVEAVFLFPWAVVFLATENRARQRSAFLLNDALSGRAVIRHNLCLEKGSAGVAEISMGPGNRPAPSLYDQAIAPKVPGVDYHHHRFSFSPWPANHPCGL